MGCKNLEDLANTKKADWFINIMYIAYTLAPLSINLRHTIVLLLIGICLPGSWSPWNEAAVTRFGL